MVSRVFGVVTLALLLASFSAMAQQGGEATLVVLVEPAQATVRIVGDGVQEELRSGEPRGLPPGFYAVTIQASGFSPQQHFLSLQEDVRDTLSVSLSRAKNQHKEESERIGWRWVLQGTFWFLILFSLTFLGYLAFIQVRFYRLTGSLSGRGISNLRAIHTPARMAGAETANFEPMRSQGELKIDGPLVIPVAARSEKFVAFHHDGATPDDIIWTLSPDGLGAVIHGRHRYEAKVIVSTSGAYQLTAYSASAQLLGTANFVAVKTSEKAWQLPWVGAGYGSILLAVIVTGALVVLGALGVLESGAIGTILGTIAGLIFGKGLSNTKSPSSGDQDGAT